jgi:hypothetical protein
MFCHREQPARRNKPHRPAAKGGADMRRPALIILLPLSFLLAAASVLTADAPDAEMKVLAVAAFKNGLGFFVRQGNLKVAAGQGKISFVPMATLGSLWVAPNDPGTSIEELVAYRYSVTKANNVASLDQLLAANTGKMVTVTYSNKEYTGEILGLTEPEKKYETPLSPEELLRGAVAKPASNLLLLKVDGRVVAMNLNGVYMVTLPDQSNYRVQHTEELKGLRFKLKGAGDSANLTMGYLQKGLGWTPSYLISLQDEKTAQVTMQAVVINDVEDITNTDLFFVVGVPNFAYSNIPSPMALEQSLAQLMQDAEAFGRGQGGGVGGGRFSNAITSQAASAEMDALSPAPGFNAAVGELVGAPEEDLFLYTRSNATLARGERATYNVFSGSVGFAHIYEWDIPDTSRVDPFGNPQNNYNNPNYDDRSLLNTVWHSLRLKNTTKFPWTSAPAMVISGTKPVSQDTLLYTPKGATTNLKLTIATDVRTDRKELEVDRQPRVEQRPGHYYDVVTVEGTLKVKNYKSKDIDLTVRKSLVGTVLSATDEGKSEKLAQAVRTENPNSRITWSLALKAGEEKIITYRYKILIRV